MEGTIQILAQELTKLLQPLKDDLTPDRARFLFAELGFNLSEAQVTALAGPFNATITKTQNLITLSRQLIESIQAENIGDIINKGTEVIQAAKDTIEGFINLRDGIDGLGLAGVTPQMISEIPERLFNYLFVRYLDRFQGVTPVISFLGILDQVEENIGLADPNKPPFTRSTLNFSRIRDWLNNPEETLRTLYKWNDNSFDGQDLFVKLEDIMSRQAIPVIYDNTASLPKLDLIFVELTPKTDITPKGIAVKLNQDWDAEYTQSGDNYELKFDVEAQMPINTELWIQPSGLTFIPPSGPQISGKASFELTVKDNIEDKPFVILGEAGGSRFEVKEFKLELGSELVWKTDHAEGIFNIEGDIIDGKVVIKPGNPDGFLAQILPPEGFTLDFDTKIGINSKKGVYFSGSGTLEFDFPLSVTLGPIAINNLTIGLTLGTDLALNMGVDIKTELGPFVAVVENMGMKTTLSFPDDGKGNIGPANIELGFKPPSGIGLSLDAGVVKGGGYLMLDFDKGQYAGAIELEFQGLFGFSAIGIITTKFPDGSEGFSLLLLINVTFDTPIALGFNFYLAGIGGIIGLHRTIVTLALQTGVKDGSIDNILFPENVIENITKIISDLDAIFPAKQDQFVLGIMARITWNTPAILIIEAGLVIEFPSPVKIVILGVIKCALPTPDEAIIELNVAFAGIIDFDNKILMFDASIFDSRILTITLAGDMALRICWGDNPDFLVSVGGFHPVYTPPAHLKLLAMKRITVNILSGNPNLVLTAYFAVTTNTIQFGAALDFSFKVSKFGIYGNFGFDVLIQFSPFRFIAGVHASVAVKLGSATLFSIGLEFNLEGPTPWRAFGYASFKILFIKFKVKFDKTWGEKRENALPSTSVLPLLIEELNKDENWNSKEGTTPLELVTYASDVLEETAVLVKPYGSLEVDQKVVPLDLTMEKFGNYKPDDISKVIIKDISIGSVEQDEDNVMDLRNSFAPAAFKNMADSDKLSAPSYEKQKSGARATSTDSIVFDYGINRKVEYESIISDYDEEELGLLQFNVTFFKGFVSGGDIGHSPLSRKLKNAKVRADKTVSLADERYAVVSGSDLKNIAGNTFFRSKAEADEFLKETVKNDPSKKGKLLLSPAFQMA